MKKVQIVIVLLCFVAFNVSFCHNDENYENYENLRNKRSILKTDENPNSVVSIDSYQSIRGGNANATEQMIVKIKLWFDRASKDISKFLKRVGRAFLEFFKIDEPNFRGVDRPDRRYETHRKIFTERVHPITREMISTTPPPPTTPPTITPTPTSISPSIISPFDHPPNTTQSIDESMTTTQNSTENAMNYSTEMTNNANSTLINKNVNIDSRVVKDGQVTN